MNLSETTNLPKEKIEQWTKEVNKHIQINNLNPTKKEFGQSGMNINRIRY